MHEGKRIKIKEAEFSMGKLRLITVIPEGKPAIDFATWHQAQCKLWRQIDSDWRRRYSWWLVSCSCCLRDTLACLTTLSKRDAMATVMYEECAVWHFTDKKYLLLSACEDSCRTTTSKWISPGWLLNRAKGERARIRIVRRCLVSSTFVVRVLIVGACIHKLFNL